MTIFGKSKDLNHRVSETNPSRSVKLRPTPLGRIIKPFVYYEMYSPTSTTGQLRRYLCDTMVMMMAMDTATKYTWVIAFDCIQHCMRSSRKIEYKKLFFMLLSSIIHPMCIFLYSNWTYESSSCRCDDIMLV